MSTPVSTPQAPEEVVTNALVREVDLTPFGFKGKMALITLDNGYDHNRPNTIGVKGLQSLNAAIDAAIATNAHAIGITGKPFIFAAAEICVDKTSLIAEVSGFTLPAIASCNDWPHCGSATAKAAHSIPLKV